MGRFLAGVGLATVFAWFFRRRRKPQPAPAQPDPAEELKQKLAESRVEAEAPPAEPEPATEPVAETEPEAAPAGVDERRREVHERARASIDQMRGQPPEG
jgi:hypothetical protein